MAYDRVFYSHLRTDRHDKQRAKIYDEWVELQPPAVQESCAQSLYLLKYDWCLGETQAKAFLVQFILFMHMKVDEQDRWRQHGEYIRAEFEFAYPGLKMREFLRETEDVPA